MDEGSTVAVLHAWVEGFDRDLLRSVEGLDDATFHARPGAKAPSIAFHLWHLARWADMFQARFATFAPALARLGAHDEIWRREGLADAWGMTGSLGREDSGWGLDDDASANLPLPGVDAVVGYANDAFAAAEERFAGLTDDVLLLPAGNIYGEDEPWVVMDHVDWYTGHGARHLGMIEALKGVLGMTGTVTT